MCTLFISRDIENSVKGHILENDAAGVLEALGQFRFSLTEIRLQLFLASTGTASDRPLPYRNLNSTWL